MERVSPPTPFDFARMMVEMQAAMIATPWIVAARYCETAAANLTHRTETPDGVPIGKLFDPTQWPKLITAWGLDALGASGLQSGLQRVRPDEIELFRRELRQAAAQFDRMGWANDPKSFHTAPPPAPNSALRIVSERGGRQEAKLVFESGYRPKAELPGGTDYLANHRTRSGRKDAAALRQHGRMDGLRPPHRVSGSASAADQDVRRAIARRRGAPEEANAPAPVIT
jgi:hypothetical protein